MTTNSIKFSHIKNKAESLLNSQFKIALVYPDESLLSAARTALQNGLAKFIVVYNKKIKDFDTIIVESPEEAVMTSIKLILDGKADTMAKGLINTSLLLSRIISSDLPIGLLTHTSILELSGYKNLFIISDGTVFPKPTIEQKVEIIKNCIKCAKVIGYKKPKIALLSASELILKNVESGYQNAVLSKMADRKQIGEAIIEGPISLDVAISKKAAEKKKINLPFEPPANVLIAPDLESGALLIKSAVYFGKAKVGGILWGTKCPIILTSRADSVEAKYISICICKLAKKCEVNKN